ncbi:MAG: hypothetical protein NZ898_10495 [Myxococcota bacterium]|nr:hypothetical protein [Myxococcota bacterium]MDW8363404.1 hypothetical protein [Myxococcales bacterium]
MPQDAELLVRVVVVRPDPERLTSTEEHLWPARSARGERRLPLPAGAAATAALGTLGPAGLFTASVHCGPVRASPASGSHARVDRGHGRS